MGCQENREACLQDREFRRISTMPVLIAMPQDFGANCKLSAIVIELCVLSDFVTAPYNPKNKNRHLHRHSAFFGTAEECIEDCCEVRTISYHHSIPVDTCGRSFVPIPKTKRSINYKTRKTSRMFVDGSRACSLPPRVMNAIY